VALARRRLTSRLRRPQPLPDRRPRLPAAQRDGEHNVINDNLFVKDMMPERSAEAQV
jgi:hypothetical protein